MDFKGRRFVFQAGERIGAGGMGEVLFGRSSDGSQEVAIKRPLAALAPEDRELFLREAAAAARAAGPGVVRVIDWGDSPPFIAYELVRDPTLDRELVRRRATNEPWSVPELLDVYAQLVAALKTINQHVLHRDLKPPNIFVGKEQVRVADFGLAKYVDEATRSRTFKGWGTAPYVSPEAWQGLSLDWRSDQYSLGVVFFEMATLQRPFSGPDEEQEQKHLYERPARVDALVQGFPTPLASTIARMLEKRREDRFGSWDEVASQVAVAAKAAVRGPVRPDPIAKMLVDNLDVHRRRELETVKAEEASSRLQAERRNLVGYWWKTFSEKVTRRLDGLNDQAGHKAITYTARDGRLEAALLNSRLEFFLEPAPLNDADVAGWGLLKVTTPKSVAVSNMFLLKEPRPYGQWMEASMEVSPLIGGQIDPSQLSRGRGGRYEIFGTGRVVVALNWTALAEQRAIRNVMSLVQYRESQLQFDNSVDECLQVLIRDASATPASRSL